MKNVFNVKVTKPYTIFNVLLLFVAMIIVDFVQYDLPINNNVYTLIVLGIYTVMFFMKKIDKSNIYIFILFLLFQDMSKFYYDEHIFNSIFLGTCKYVFIFFTFLIGSSKGALKNKNLLIYLYFFLAVLFMSILKGQVNYYIAKDIIFYLNLFSMPILLAYILKEKHCYDILKLYKIFVYSYPLFAFTLLQLGRFNEISGSLYVVVGSVDLMNLAYLVGLVLKKETHNKLLMYIWILMYLGLFLLSPSSGGLLVIMCIGIYYVLAITKNIDLRVRITVFLALAIIFLVAFSFVLNYILTSPKYLGTFLRFKVIQIVQMLQANSIEALPFSVRVRAVEVLDILNCQNPSQFFFGRGFGGYFEDTLNMLGQINAEDNAFSIEEIASGKYYTTHFIFSHIFLKFGMIGTVLFTKLGIDCFKVARYEWTEFVPVLIVVLYSCAYGIKLVFLFAFIFGALTKLQWVKKYKNI